MMKGFANQYKHDEQSHFYSSVQLGWEKLDEYYKLTDKSPAYVAAICLHPRYKWKYIQKKWAHKPNWIKEAELGVQRLWNEYKMLNLKDLDISPLEKSNCEASRIDNFIDNDLSDTDSDSDDFLNEYNKWMAGGREKKCNDPIQYWWS